jgi:membrane-bound lytic murein transglycosylase D
LLLAVAKKKRDDLDTQERRVLELWGEDADPAQLREASRRVRFQLGQSDKFLEGLIRAGAWHEYITQVLQREGVPAEIAYLPHVESSFNPIARSHVGAVGLWQFMPSTGRRFMRVDHVVDERLDPFRSSEAAALLMRANYEVTNSWPLAITAYNHGAAGMRRAIAQVGTDDIERVVRTYRSRSFGFASRNFYVAFLAAVDVASNPEKYFGSFERHAPDTSPTLELPNYVAASTLAVALGVDRATLAMMNPSLLRPVWDGTKLVPRGFRLRVPARDDVDWHMQLAGISGHDWQARQTPDLYHVVQRGETLSSIAPRYHARVSDLVALNGLSSQHRIRAGQRLILPAAKGRASESVVDEGVYSNTAEAANAPATVAVAEKETHPAAVVAVEVAAATAPAVPSEAAPPLDAAVAPGTIAAAPAVDTRPASIDATPPMPADAVDGGIEQPPVAVPVDTEAVLALADTTEAPADETDDRESVVVVPELKADPSDYLVAEDGSIRVQDAESLGHFADWLGIRASALRKLNGLAGRSTIRVGGRLKLDFSKATPDVFEQRRMAYHQGLQEAFFAQHRITGTNEHVIKRGESIWVLAEKRYKIPVWLLRQYNPDVDLAMLRPGTRVVIPVLVERNDEARDTGDVAARSS